MLANADNYTLTIHKNDNMGSSGSLMCQDFQHCLYQIKKFEYQGADKACNYLEIKKDGEVIYSKRFVGTRS